MRRAEKEKVRGDMLRELIFLVYLRNKYDLKPEVKVSTLKSLLGYSAGGIDYAIKYSGFFETKGDEIKLSKKGEDYVKRELLPPYKAFNPVGYFLILLGFLLILQWYMFVNFNDPIIFGWESGLLLIIGGLILRFWLLPLLYWALKILKKL